jgi:aminoglycoside phosphotransferase (APT) family kinase protein
MESLNNEQLTRYLRQAHGADVIIDRVRELGGASASAAALKAFGYGRPLRVDYRLVSPVGPEGPRSIVLHQVRRNGFGREHDADRFAAVWLDFATFGALPHHVPAQDILALTADGQLQSARDVRDFWLVTPYVAGQPYADDLLRLRETGELLEQDKERVAELARYLAAIHTVKRDDPLLWRRRLRDLVGHGEGVLGLTDSYAPDDPIATPECLRAIETDVNAWRWRLKPYAHRLSQVHGDFHPFNLLFEASGVFHLLDRSRGAWGEPADDVSCMAINYLFFALQRDGELKGPFRELYDSFWTTYLDQTRDQELLAVIAPWFAWRALVLASPQWYPGNSADVRRKLLRFARNVLAETRFQWQEAQIYVDM